MAAEGTKLSVDYGTERIALAMGDRPLLVYTIHPDDFAIGAAGTSYKASKRGKVYVVNIVPPRLYGGYERTRDEVNYDRIKDEFYRSCEILGCEGIFDLEESEWLPKDYKRGTLGDPDPNDELLEKIIVRSIRDIRPGVVLFPLENDHHKDHKNGSLAIQYATWRSGRPSRVSELGEPWHSPNQLHEVLEYPVIPILMEQSGLLYVDITGEPSDKKSEAMLAHQSQMSRDQLYWFDSRLRDMRSGIILHGTAELNQLFPDKVSTLEDLKRASLEYISSDNVPMAEVFIPSGFASR